MSQEDGGSRVLSVHLHDISHHLHAVRPGLLLPGFPPGHDGGDQLQLGLLCKVLETHLNMYRSNLHNNLIIKMGCIL